jgi:DNA segregation ATPase FtsK/SpoIIIE, S-DNA-T family
MALQKYPIKHWSYSSLMSYLRNPLAWYKRYVEHVYDTPSTPAGIVGRAGHVALQHFYAGLGKPAAIELGADYLRGVPDFEVNFGVHTGVRAQAAKRAAMLDEYYQAVGFYLARPPRYKVLGIEVASTVSVPGLLLPIKAISDLVVESKGNPGAIDIVDHKFVDSFSPLKEDKPLFVLQALFNYYTIGDLYKKPVKRFILQECKKRKNKDGKSQMRRYLLSYDELSEDFLVFERLINDATKDISTRTVYLPNPSDMFEGKNSFEVYRMNL